MMKSMGKQAQRAFGRVALVWILGLLASCGGGTEQIEPFAPTRLLIFGDEMSVLTRLPQPGLKYSVNALQTDNITLDCVSRPIWHQVVAYTYGFAYEECNPNNQAVTAARIFATVGAKSDDLPTQIEEARALTGRFTSTDLVTVLIGANDVLDLFQNQYLSNPTAQTADTISQELTRRGARLGQRVNELTTLGPRVILSTVPLMNVTPYALQLSSASRDPNLLTVLLNFSNAFNTAVRVNIINDGRFIGLVELDALLNAASGDPGRYGLVNSIDAVCSVPLPACNTNTLVTNGNATTWLWASDLWMGSTAHLNLGNFARNRALGNPF